MAHSGCKEVQDSWRLSISKFTISTFKKEHDDELLEL